MKFNCRDKYGKMTRALGRLERIYTDTGNAISMADALDATEDFLNHAYHFKDFLKRGFPAKARRIEEHVTQSRVLSLVADLHNSLKHAEDTGIDASQLALKPVGEQGGQADLGFRVLKLDTSNIKAWDAEFEDVEGALLSSVENVKPGRSEADVLYELLLKFGLDLAVPIEQREVAGKDVHIIGAGALIVCLADDIGLDVVEGVATLKDELSPETIRVVFKDAGFANDVVKTNAVQILHQAGIEDVRSL